MYTMRLSVGPTLQSPCEKSQKKMDTRPSTVPGVDQTPHERVESAFFIISSVTPEPRGGRSQDSGEIRKGFLTAVRPSQNPGGAAACQAVQEGQVA